MAIRSDITVDWVSSPRIITVLSDSTSLNLQDLVDTCRHKEAGLVTMQHPRLISAAGKEDLGGGVAVGITVTLQNAKVAFESRPGSDYVQCTIAGGNLVALDASANTMDPIEVTAFTQIIMALASHSTTVEVGISGLTEEESATLSGLPSLSKIISALLAFLR